MHRKKGGGGGVGKEKMSISVESVRINGGTSFHLLIRIYEFIKSSNLYSFSCAHSHPQIL